MSEQQIKEYLQKYNITSKELLAFHIEELKRNTKPNTKLISELVYVLEDSFFSFSFGEKEIDKRLKLVNYYNEKAIKEYNLDTPLTKASRDYEKSLNNHVSEVIDTKLGEYARTELEPDYRPPFFLDEVLEHSEEEKMKAVWKDFKIKEEELLKDYEQIVTTTITVETNPVQAEKIKEIVREFNNQNSAEKNKLDWIPTDATNIEVFHLDTKDNGDKTAFIGFKIKNGNFSFVEVPFTSPKIAEKESKEQRLKTEENLVFSKDSEINKEGIKESNGKTDYSEINLEILDLMAVRFTANKHKYPQGNMKKPIDIKYLEWALFRHVKKMIQPIETDEENYKDHLSAVLCNASMILDQLKNNG